MAEHAGEYHRGEMEIAEQTATFHGFIGMVKWGSLATAAFVLFLVMMFCAHAGFMQSALTAIVLVAAGVFLLREKKSAGH
jgi:hypothetical protein